MKYLCGVSTFDTFERTSNSSEIKHVSNKPRNRDNSITWISLNFTIKKLSFGSTKYIPLLIFIAKNQNTLGLCPFKNPLLFLILKDKILLNSRIFEE